jgi:TP901 family phage tail tape measure protein
MPRGNVRVSITADPSGLKRGVREAETSLQRLDKSAASGVASAAKFAATSAGIASVGIAITKAATATIDFDKAMRNVNSIAQLSEKQLASLDKQVLKLAGKTAQAPETLANGLYDLVSSGFDAKESMEILASSAKAATAGLTTTEISTKAVAAVLNAYHRPAKDAAQISDDLFQTVNRGVISFETLSTSIGDVLPFASSLSIGLKSVGASISTMTKEGLSGEEATTRLKNVMVALLKPSEDAQKAIKQLGFANAESLVKAKGFQGAIEALVSTTDGSKAAVARLFPNIRALGGALALTGKNTRSAESDLRAFQHTSGATDKALSQQSKSISYNWNKVKATFSAFSIEAGFALIKFGRGVATFVDKNREAFNQALAGARQFFRGFEEGVRGLVKIVSGLLTLNFKRAWDGVKDIVHGALDQAVGVIKTFTSPFRKWGANLGHAVVDGIVNAIKSAPSAVADAVNSIIPSPVRKGLQKTGNLLDKLNPFGASGGVIAGPRGAGDIVPLWTKPGEVLLTEEMQHALGQDRVLNTVSALGGKMLGRGSKARTGGVIGPNTVAKMQGWANSMTARNYPYVYGGGHAGFGPSNGGFDCSGFVSSILMAGGAIGGPMAVYQPLAGALSPGPGRFVTVGIRGSSGRNAHTMIKVGGRYYESGGGGNGAHTRAGWNGSFDLFHPRNEATGGTTATTSPSLGANSRKPAKKKVTYGIDTEGRPDHTAFTGGNVPIGAAGTSASLPSYTAGETAASTGVSDLDAALGDIDLHQHAGDITPDQASAQKIDVLKGAIASGTFNGQPLSAHDILALRAELGDLASAIKDNTAELLALKTQQADNTQKLLNVSQAQYPQLFASFLDAFSGGIGGRVGLGFMSPSTAGRLASY